MPLSVFNKLGLGEARLTTVSLQLADRSIKHPIGVVENILVKVDKFIFLADFIVLNMEEDRDNPLILGQPFLAMRITLIDVQQGKLILRVQDEQVTFNVFEAMKYPSMIDSCFQVDAISKLITKISLENIPREPLEACITHSGTIHSKNPSIRECAQYLEASPPYMHKKKPKLEELEINASQPKPYTQVPPMLELKYIKYI